MYLIFWCQLDPVGSIYDDRHKTLVALIVETRKQAGLRQTDIAGRMGEKIYQQIVSNMESGQRRIDVVELDRLLDAIGVDFLDFMQTYYERTRGQ